jgi:Flp pilus assembly protein TadG
MTTHTLIDKVLGQLRRIRVAQRGNVVLTFALAAIPVVGAVGAAVDYSRANNYRSQLQAAADAASVGAVAKSSPAVQAAITMYSDGPIGVGVTDAKNIFDSQIASKGSFWTNLVRTATVARSNGAVISTVQFTANVQTMMMGLFGKSTIAISGTSSSSLSLPLYIDFYLLLDNSPSMGLGATTNDINNLIAATANKANDASCAFACHDLCTKTKDKNNNPIPCSDWYTVAKSNGITMRIDVLRTATQQLMDTAQSTETFSNQFRMAIYTLGADATNRGLTSIQSLTTNLSTAKSSAGTIDLMTVPYQNYQDDTQTDLLDAMTNLNAAIPTAGTGTTSSSPLKYVFFVSDGVVDRTDNGGTCAASAWSGTGSDPVTGTSYPRCEEPLDVSICTTMKNRGIKIAVLYTTYLPVPNNGWYNSTVAPWSSNIATNMQNCASPNLYFEVSPTQGISDAMNALFKKALAEAHITQ